MKTIFNKTLAYICAMFTIICIVSSAEASAQDLATLIDQAQKGDPESQFILAYRYHDGDGVPTDYAIAFQWWMKAAQQGHVESQYNVAFLYERGEGVEQDYAEAFFWYKKAADQGMAAAQHVIGLMYIYGRVVEKNIEIAESWFKKAVDQNFVGSLFYLGVCYYARRDYQETMALWTKAAEHGVQDAKYQLGQMYENGIGTERNLDKAIIWYLDTAQDGNSLAQFRLGNCLYALDRYDEAMEWWLKSGSQGEVSALYNAAVCYEMGIAIEKDSKKAMELYTTAAEKGHEGAKEAVNGKLSFHDMTLRFQHFLKSIPRQY